MEQRGGGEAGIIERRTNRVNVGREGKVEKSEKLVQK